MNEAVEIAHNDGILTAASLMVGGAAFDDAVSRAQRMPALHVGLHVVLVDGTPVLPAKQVPDLVDTAGRFRNDLFRLGAGIFMVPRMRHQVAAEVSAQFERYAATGLAFDHVDAHRHFHLHPTICGIICRIGQRYGVKSLRVPLEPTDVLAQVESGTIGLEARLAGKFAAWTARRLRGRGFFMADQVFGLAWSGAMTANRVERLVAGLPDGVSEIYFHPATSNRFKGGAGGYLYAEELAALIDPNVGAAIRDQNLRLTSYSELVRS